MKKNRAQTDVAKSKRARPIYMADFETTTTANDCRVWLWGQTTVMTYGELDWNIDIESYMIHVAQHDSIVYFHNLKFDGHFIMDWLLKNGFAYQGDSRKLHPMQFSTLISNMGKWYSFKIRFINGVEVEFRDSLKKINMPVSAIASAFGLDMSKGDIDYHKPRPVGYEPDDNELDYLERDIRIVAQALEVLIGSGMKKLTVAADSLAEYKRLVGDKYFDRMFPVLNDEMDNEIRRAYRGGFTYADDRFKGRKVGRGIVLDVNSLYPYIMYDRLLPYGEPEWVDGRVQGTKDRPLVIFSVTFTAKLKPDHVPCIQIKGSSIFGGTEYLTEINEPTNLMVTDVDWKLYQDHYDIEVIEWGGGWRFRAAVGLFKEYIDKWMAVKANSVGGQREIAKLHLNSLYGKFASNPIVTGKIPVLEDGHVKLVMGPDERKPPVYTAVGVYVTSWARDLTIRAAQANYHTFAYADTDSLHLLGDGWEIGKGENGKDTLLNPPEGIYVHGSDLGAWKFEYGFSEAWYVRAKAYLEKKLGVKGACHPRCEKDHKHVRAYHAAWAGLPQREQEKLTFKDMRDGNVIHGKLQPRSVVGGVVLEDVPYTLKM